ncbi:unnamed protein product [Litomosoides sigmodontis]|uniref:C2H2-type domain-containing protein n=1 Tax=Litomosoides sigmodontis TaxID=42156 RepID=A0A3P6TP70_LITSI|nr:unnamed protein product [Litomosoides sigmodontis]
MHFEEAQTEQTALLDLSTSEKCEKRTSLAETIERQLLVLFKRVIEKQLKSFNSSIEIQRAGAKQKSTRKSTFFANKTMSGNRNRHMRTHIGNKPYSCPECNDSFNRLWNLQRHLTTHDGKKRYICPECNRKFTCPSSMRRHVSIHTHGKRYSCPECNKNFTRSTGMKRHLMSHAGEKRFGR